MATDIKNKLVIAISSRALFDLDASHEIYEKDGVDSYQDHQIEHEDDVLKKGVAFNLVEKLLNIKSPVNDHALVEVILLSRNSADTGLRVFNSIEHYGLDITRAAFSCGKTPYRYIKAFAADLFLSAHPKDVKNALQAGCAAATINASNTSASKTKELRIAFDGDAVLFSDEAERIYQEQGLEAFAEYEKNAAKKPLSDGPFKNFLSALQRIQTQFPADSCPIRTALVTARSAPAHERVIRTLRAWGIRIDEALFLGGLAKGEFLKAFAADFFFDDQHVHVKSASEHVASAHVPNGITNTEL